LMHILPFGQDNVAELCKRRIPDAERTSQVLHIATACSDFCNTPLMARMLIQYVLHNTVSQDAVDRAKLLEFTIEEMSGRREALKQTAKHDNDIVEHDKLLEAIAQLCYHKQANSQREITKSDFSSVDAERTWEKIEQGRFPLFDFDGGRAQIFHLTVQEFLAAKFLWVMLRKSGEVPNWICDESIENDYATGLLRSFGYQAKHEASDLEINILQISSMLRNICRSGDEEATVGLLGIIQDVDERQKLILGFDPNQNKNNDWSKTSLVETASKRCHGWLAAGLLMCFDRDTITRTLTNRRYRKYAICALLRWRAQQMPNAAQVLANGGVEKFDFENQRLSDAHCMTIARGIESVTQIKILSLPFNQIGDAGAVAIADLLKNNTAVQKISMSGNLIGDQGAGSLAEALKMNTTLQEIVLWGNKIGDAGAASLAESLKINTTLKEIDLGHNQIGHAGAGSLAEALKINTTVQYIYLYGNRSGDAGAAALAESLKTNTALQHIDLESNQITDAGATSLSEALKVNTTMQRIRLDYNQIGDAGATSLAESLKINTALITIELAKNQIGDAGATSLAEALKVNTTVQTIGLIGNQIADAGEEILREAQSARDSLTIYGV